MQLWGYVQNNYPKLLAGAGAVVIVVLIGVFIKQQSDRRTRVAMDALGEVNISLAQGNNDEAVLQAEKIAKDYSGKPAARQALILLGNLHFAQDRHSEARISYQEYLDTYGDEGPSGYGARAGIAACLEEQGKYREAAEEYAAYADKYPASPFAPMVLKEAARCYRLAGDSEKAQASLQRIVDGYSESAAARTAKAELTQMGVLN